MVPSIGSRSGAVPPARAHRLPRCLRLEVFQTVGAPPGHAQRLALDMAERDARLIRRGGRARTTGGCPHHATTFRRCPAADVEGTAYGQGWLERGGELAASLYPSKWPDKSWDVARHRVTARVPEKLRSGEPDNYGDQLAMASSRLREQGETPTNWSPRKTVPLLRAIREIRRRRTPP
jgi:hypothetical protein